MNDSGFIKTIFHFTCFHFFDRLFHVHRNRTGLRVRHQALGAEHTTDTTYHTHHIGRGDHNVEIKPVFVLDFGDEFFRAYVIGTCRRSRICLRAFRDNEHFLRFTGAVGKDENAADLLIRLTGINAETDVKFDGLVEFCFRRFKNDAYGFRRVVGFRKIECFYAVRIIFSVFHFCSFGGRYRVLLRKPPATFSFIPRPSRPCCERYPPPCSSRFQAWCSSGRAF